MRELTSAERAALSVGTNPLAEREGLPEYLSVTRLGLDLYEVRADNRRLYKWGNQAQVHNWLARHNYKRVQFAPGSWVLGTFKRPKETAA